MPLTPDVIPYGTLLYITYHGRQSLFTVMPLPTDTGIAVQKGQILVDLFL